MKRTAQLILAVCLVILLSGFVLANDSKSFQLIGREVFPGIDLGSETVGALFVGKFFDANYIERGQFSVSLDHNGKNIEVCNEATKLLRFKLIMSFKTGGRLVLVGPTGDDPVVAQWYWDDPNCPLGNCPLTNYTYYITLLTQAEVDPGSVLWPCAQVDPDNAFIAKVSQFDVVKQRLGSYGVGFTGGSVSGWLVHTPVVSPAIVGTVDLE